ncbi:MAG: glycosyltransferase family 4 protein [Akkermansia sp.]|nr:glycosyltransferase family 4 protein [Akkermansia sp.]
MSELSVFMHPRAFWIGKYTGVSRYVCELIQGLLDKGVEVQLPILDTPNGYLRKADFFPLVSQGSPKESLLWKCLSQVPMCPEWAELARRQMLRTQSLKALKTFRYDLVHPTHNNSTEILPHIKKTPLVITIHDMTHELFPQSFSPADPSARRKREFARRADRIIAISRRTKEDAVRILGVDPDIVDVVYHGNSLTLPRIPLAHIPPLPERYVLFVGKRAGYKNFENFIKAFSIIHQKAPELHLICVGGGAFSDEENRLIAELRLASFVRQLPADDALLATLYSKAEFFVYPSLYEGFGLPLLEAFSCGAPVVCSDASCFPEIAGDAALYFDGNSVENIAEAMEEAFLNETLRSKLRKKGTERLTHFSWAKCAEETLTSYQRVL